MAALLFASIIQVRPTFVYAADSLYSETHGGDYAVEVYAVNASWGDAAYTSISVAPDTDYQLTFWVKGQGTIQVGAGTVKQSNANEVENNGSGNGSGHYNVTASSTWTQWTVHFNSASFSDWVVYVKDRGGSNKTESKPVYLDDLSVTEVGGDGTNLVSNPGFEGGDNGGWSFPATLDPNMTIRSFAPSAAITPSTASYNLWRGQGQDITVQLQPNSYTFNGINNGVTFLQAGVDYTLEDTTVTIRKSYLSTLSVGDNVLIFDFDEGIDPTLTITGSESGLSSIVDELADFSQMYERSLTSDGKETLRAPGDPNDNMNGNSTRIFKRLAGDYTGATPPETVYAGQHYFVYRVDSEITNFVLEAFYSNNPSHPVAYPTLWVSTDGNDYEQISTDTYNVAQSTVPENNSFTLHTLSSYDVNQVLEGASYFKVILPPDSTVVPGWAVQYGKVLINSGASPVTATPGNSTIPKNGSLTVTLSSETEGSSIYYYTNSDTEHKLYTEPLVFTEQTVLHTYASKEGLVDSAVVTYTYHSADAWAIDRFGQKYSATYDKVTSYDELRADLVDDAQYYGSLNPPDWDDYGGLPNSGEEYELEATGFFRIDQIQDVNGKTKYTMVDPLGNIYYSVAANLTGSVGETYTDVGGREQIYEWLPTLTSDNGKYASAFRQGNQQFFSHYIANYIEKYGKPFTSNDYYILNVDRLLRWGFNGAGGFGADTSNPPVGGQSMPQVRFVDPPSNFRFGTSNFFDAFKAGAAEAVAAIMAGDVANRKNDPNIIGYFFGNEYHYHNFTKELLQAKASTAATKGALVDWLEGKYQTIEAFNTAWNMNFASFNDMDEATLSIKTDSSYEDMLAFFEVWLDKYYSIMAVEFRKVDPNHMLLGDRLFANMANNADLRNIIAKVQGDYVDVISYNYYTYDPDLDRLQEMVNLAGGKPIIVTEFHFGEPAQGLGGGVKGVANEDDKGKSYRHYVEQVAASGLVVGTHWFSNIDQAPTGRYFEGHNGEAYGIGFINVTDRPYKLLMDHIMETNYNIYDIVLGIEDPYDFTDYIGSDQGGKLVHIAKANVPIVVDGVKDSLWPQGETIHLTDSNRVLGLTTAEWGADVHLAWDTEHLYIFADVQDPTPLQNTRTDTSNWEGDTLELFVGPYKIDASGGILPKDSQLLISASETPPEGHVGYRWYNNKVDQPIVQKAVELHEDGIGYTIEVAVKLADLNITLADEPADMQIRFDIGFDNGAFDGVSQSKRTAQYLWSGVDGNAQSREKWGMAVFKQSPTSVPTPGTTPAPTPTPNMPPASTSEEAGTVKVTLTETDERWFNSRYIEIPEVPGAKVYMLDMPASFLMKGQGNGSVTLSTPLGQITIPDQMLDSEGAKGKQASLIIREIEVSQLPDHVRNVVGNRPIIDLSLLIDGREVFWSNEEAAVTVTLPYTPSALEKADTEHIVVWYIDEKGNVEPVSNGRYDASTGMVTFKTTHFSHYAVAFLKKTYSDLGGYEWARHAIEVLASKGIINGMDEGRFAPAERVTRADFVLLLVHTLELKAKADSNFADAAPGYYYEALSIAKKLGIVKGVNENKFEPDAYITRQEMMTLAVRALKALKAIEEPDELNVLNKFGDVSDIAEYAANSIATLVAAGMINGMHDGTVNPAGLSTRAQVATFLYRLYQRN